MTSRSQQQGSQVARKLHRNLAKARTFQELELAVSASEEDLSQSDAAMKEAQFQAYFEDDLSLFSAEEIKKAKQKEGESLKGTYEQVSRQSLTAQQLQQVIQTTWTFEERSSHDGNSRLRARIIDKAFQQQLLDLDSVVCASTSHMSLKFLLTLSLINKWAVSTATISSALLPAPKANEELVLVEPPPELEQDPGMLWQLIRTWYGIKTSPKLWQQHVAGKLEELGLTKNTVDPSIFSNEQLLVMHHLDTLLIVGDKLQQESFLSQLSASVSLHDITQLAVKTPLSFLNKTLEWNQQEHSMSLHLPASYYLKLLRMYDMTQARATNALDDQLCHTDRPRKTTTLDGTREQLYRTVVGQLLWATPVRPDLSFAVTELSKSLQAPTSQDEQQLKKVLRYIKGILHFTNSLQPPRKRAIERASSRQLQASFDSTLEGSLHTQKSTSGATISLWGVPLATPSRSQALHASSLAEAELYAMGMATQDALHKAPPSELTARDATFPAS